MNSRKCMQQQSDHTQTLETKMDQDIVRAILLLQSWPEECLALFNLQQSPSKSILAMPEVRDQFEKFLQHFTADLSLLQTFKGKD